MAIENKRMVQRHGTYNSFLSEDGTYLPNEFQAVDSGDPRSGTGKGLYFAFDAGTAEQLATYENVQALVSEASEDLQDEFLSAVNTATNNANKATSSANNAASAANTAANRANQAAEAVEDATSAVINDNTPSNATTYSSNKIDQKISGMIDDGTASETKTFSSSKMTTDFIILEKNLYTEIQKNSDLNDYITKGNYACFLSANVPSIKNRPTGLTYAFKLVVEEIAESDQLIQKITENWLGNEFCRTYSGGNWGNWFHRGTLSIFNSFTQLEITDLPCMTLDVFKAMPNNSIGIFGTDTTSGISDLPINSGTLEITKINNNQYKIAFYKSSGGTTAVIKGLWLGTTNTALDQLTWSKYLSEEDVVNNGTTTVEGKILDARFGKTLLDKFSGYLQNTGGNISGDLNVGGWLQPHDLRTNSIWIITDNGNALLSDVNEGNGVISVGYGATDKLYKLGITGKTIELTPSDENKVFGITMQAYKEATNNKRTIFRSATNGGAYLGSASYCWNTAFFTNAITQSDRKAKDNIMLLDADKAKDFIMALKPSSYTLKNSDSDNPRLHLGLIAQEVAEAAKYTDMGDLSLYQAAVISDKKDGDEAPYSEDIPDEKLSWGLNYNELIAPLIRVVQAQQKQIDLLMQYLAQD